MSLQTFTQPTVVRQFHDDWLLWAVYADGSVREFDTEGWVAAPFEFEFPPEFLAARPIDDWPRIEQIVATGKCDLLSRLLRFRLDNPEVDEQTFFRLFNAWFESLGDWPTDAQLYCFEQTESNPFPEAS